MSDLTQKGFSSGQYVDRFLLRDKLCAEDAITMKGVAILNEFPAADVVEVVRCRECIFWDTSWNPGVGMTGEAHYCPRCHLVTLKDSFCSGAYRKEGGQDDV